MFKASPCSSIGIAFSQELHLCPEMHAMAKIAKIAIFRVLQKIVSLTIFCVARDFSLFFVMLYFSKNCDFSNFSQFLEKSQKLEKSQFFLDTLLPPLTLDLVYFNKNCDFSNFSPFLEKSQKLENSSSVRGG